MRLRLVESLDREQVSNYSVRIVALDGGTPPNSAVLEVLVVVKDANDNAPRLASENYEATLEENLRVDTAILQVRAEDPDEGMNANLTYSFTEDTLHSHGDIFRIVAGDGWIYLKGLIDYEREKKLVLTVIVADQGSMPLTAYARVVIYVSDVNDNAPEISVNNMPGRMSPEVGLIQSLYLSACMYVCMYVDEFIGSSIGILGVLPLLGAPRFCPRTCATPSPIHHTADVCPLLAYQRFLQ